MEVCADKTKCFYLLSSANAAAVDTSALRSSCLRILFETLLSKALVVGVYKTSILYSLQADGKRDSLWFLWLVFTCCTIHTVHRLMCNVQCAVYGVELETKAIRRFAKVSIVSYSSRPL